MAGHHGDHGRAERRDPILDRLLRPASERHHRDDRRDADHDAKHREQGAQLVGAQSAKRDGDDFLKKHAAPLARTGAALPAASAACVLIHSRNASHSLTEALVLLLPLRLESE